MSKFSTSFYCRNSETEGKLKVMPMTQDGWLLCGDGGYGSDNVTGRSCLEFSPETGGWRHTGHALRQWRGNHVSWDLGAAGTLLLGGGYDGGGDTAEIVRLDGTVEASYDLKYDTR